MVGHLRRGASSGSHRRIAELRERAMFAPEALEARKLLAVVVWDGDAGDGDFANPLNWEGDVMPGPGDDAVIDVSSGPFVELRDGDFVSLKSLVVDWPLAINGTLGVSEHMTVGAVFFDIGASGRLESNNITVQPATGGISNDGEWTIGGTSLIERRVVSTGTLRIGNEADLTLGAGLGFSLQRGILDSTDGRLDIGYNATITGVGVAEAQIRVSEVLNVGENVEISVLSLHADGAAVNDQVRVNFDGLLAATIMGSRVRLDYALVTGDVHVVDSEIEVRGRAVLFGDVTVQGGEIDVEGALVARAPASLPGQAGSLAAQDTTVRVLGRLHGRVTVTASDVVAYGFETSMGQGLELHDVQMFTSTAIPHAMPRWFVDGSLIATGLRVTGGLMVVNPGGTLTLAGSGQNELGGLFEVLGGGTIDWTGGDLRLSMPTGAARTVHEGGTLRAAFAGATLHELELDGPGHVRVRGEFILAFDDPAGGLIVRSVNGGSNSGLWNSGRVEVKGGLLDFESGLTNTQAGRLGGAGSEWVVGPGATLELDETITTNAAALTVIDDGAIPGLADVTLNAGVITLDGAGGWAGVQAGPFALRNRGEIRKVGEGVRMIAGTITNLAAGTVAAHSGHMVVDAPQFINYGTVSIGSNAFQTPRAVFSVTGDYRESGHAQLEIIGVADGDAGDLPRFGAGGRMLLAGDLRITLTTTVPFAPRTAWQLGFASAGRVGRFASVSLVIAGVPGSVAYTAQRFLVTIGA